MNEFESIRILALRSVVKDTPDYRLRHIFRWYSEKFHTALHLVDDLPIENILEAWYECEFETLKDDNKDGPDKLNEMLADLQLTPEQLVERKITADAKEAEEVRFLEQIKKDKALHKIKDIVKPVHEKMMIPEPSFANLPKFNIPAPPPDIDYKFERIDEEIDEDRGMFDITPPKKK